MENFTCTRRHFCILINKTSLGGAFLRKTCIIIMKETYLVEQNLSRKITLLTTSVKRNKNDNFLPSYLSYLRGNSTFIFFLQKTINKLRKTSNFFCITLHCILLFIRLANNYVTFQNIKYGGIWYD